jgi:hypothetical protein
VHVPLPLDLNRFFGEFSMTFFFMQTSKVMSFVCLHSRN